MALNLLNMSTEQMNQVVRFLGHRDSEAIALTSKNGRRAINLCREVAPLRQALSQMVTFQLFSMPCPVLRSTSIESLQWIWQRGSTSIMQSELWSRIFFFRACYFDIREMINPLLPLIQINEEVDFQFTQRTALEIATLRGHSTLVRHLIDHHADPNLNDESGASPFLLSVYINRVDTFKAFVKHPSRVTTEQKIRAKALAQIMERDKILALFPQNQPPIDPVIMASVREVRQNLQNTPLLH